MRYCNLKFEYNKASVKSTTLQNCAGKKKTPCQSKPHQNLMKHKMCLAICIITKPHLGKVCIFLPILFKVGSVWLMRCCVVILVAGIIIDYVFMKTLLILQKKGYKNWGPKILAFSLLQLCSTDCWQLESAKIIEIRAVVQEIV